MATGATSSPINARLQPMPAVVSPHLSSRVRSPALTHGHRFVQNLTIRAHGAFAVGPHNARNSQCAPATPGVHEKSGQPLRELSQTPGSEHRSHCSADEFGTAGEFYR
jgi:hypothetical protein